MLALDIFAQNPQPSIHGSPAGESVRRMKDIGDRGKGAMPSRNTAQVLSRIIALVGLAVSQSVNHQCTSFRLLSPSPATEAAWTKVGSNSKKKSTYGDLDAIVGEDQGRVG